MNKKVKYSDIVLILGSAPDALEAKFWRTHPFDSIVAINNAWKIRPDWTHSIYPTDFPTEKRPKPKYGKLLISANDYVKDQNSYGGFVYAGGTMAFTAAYWALANFSPKVIAFLGCDMVYTGKSTHFYGKGTADPLRNDITLRSLEAKSARLETIANMQNCRIYNLSTKSKSRLIFHRATIDNLRKENNLKIRNFNQNYIIQAQKYEQDLNYFIEDGKYWKHQEKFDQNKIDILDSLWLSCII